MTDLEYLNIEHNRESRSSRIMLGRSLLLIFISVMLTIVFLSIVIKPELKSVDNWKGCVIAKQCVTQDGWKVLIIAKEGKK
jgi:hypothetical protein